MDAQSLVVDRAGVAVPLVERELRAWAAGTRVFISSVMAGLETERHSAAEAIRALDATPVWFEEFGGRDADPEEAYLAEVDSSDIYVGIIGTRYGRQDPSTDSSATHAEYLRAVDRGLRVCVWVLDGGAMEGHQRSFMDEVRAFYVTEFASSPDHLAQRVAVRLRTIAAEDAAPWCKLGCIVARATEIVDDGTRLG